MESNSAERRLRVRTLVAGVLGIVVGVLAMVAIPALRAQEQPPPVNLSDNDGLTVTLYLRKSKGSARTLELQGCGASEKNGVTRPCSGTEKTVKRVWSGQAAVEWNGDDGGSGCTTVGGTRYCW